MALFSYFLADYQPAQSCSKCPRPLPSSRYQPLPLRRLPKPISMSGYRSCVRVSGRHWLARVSIKAAIWVRFNSTCTSAPRRNSFCRIAKCYCCKRREPAAIYKQRAPFCFKAYSNCHYTGVTAEPLGSVGELPVESASESTPGRFRSGRSLPRGSGCSCFRSLRVSERSVPAMWAW